MPSSIALSKSRANNFARVIVQRPELLTCNTYLNFLRYYKMQHPRYGLRKILQDGFKAWRILNTNERKQFKQKKGRTSSLLRPRLKWSTKSRLTKITRQRMPTTNKRRYLSAKRHIRKRKRNVKRVSRYRPKQLPPHQKYS